MESESKVCQNCKKDFIIETEDFNFYEKMKVPAPKEFEKVLKWFYGSTKKELPKLPLL